VHVTLQFYQGQQVSLSSRGCLGREGQEICADIRTPGEALLIRSGSFWDVEKEHSIQLGNVRKPLKRSHQVVFRRENEEIDTVVYIRKNQLLKVGGTIHRIDGAY
jgi:hypothetical protein